MMHQPAPRIVQVPSKSALAPSIVWSLLLAPMAIVCASGLRRADLAKIALLATFVTGFFLFTGKTWLPGGGFQFMLYAEAIVHGTTLSPDIAQRDAGFPLLVILSGYTALGSIIPIFLIHAAFAITLPLLIYAALWRFSPSIAFYTALLGIVTLGPIYFMKMIHHDQTYVFFTLLTTCLLLIFLQTRKFLFLYSFAFAAIAASISRPAGNALFPFLLVMAYLAVRGNVRHYLACALIFVAALAFYGWHRYVIFDMRHSPTIPSYTGEQLFYNPYVNTYDYGIRLVPREVGPNLVAVVERLRERLQPSPKDSVFVQQVIDSYPQGYQREFIEANILPFTVDELIDRVFAVPIYEYWSLLCAAAEDRLMLAAAWEVMRAYPGLVLRYSLRNLWHFVFDPGYAHTRYNLGHFHSNGLPFYPAIGGEDPAAAIALAARAVREVQFDPLQPQPPIVGLMFRGIVKLWHRNYRRFVSGIAALMCVAWAAALVGFACLARGHRTGSAREPLRYPPPQAGEGRVGDFDPGLLACVVTASVVFGYNALVTSVVVDPDFRYRQMMELQAVLVAGFGLVCLRHWWQALVAPNIDMAWRERMERVANSLRATDLFVRSTSTQLTIAAIAAVLVTFASWTIFMLRHTAA